MRPPRSSLLPWRWVTCLPLERAVRQVVEAPPAVPEGLDKLVDLVADASGLSKTKVRVLVARGRVLVNGSPAYDPDQGVSRADEIEVLTTGAT